MARPHASEVPMIKRCDLGDPKPFGERDHRGVCRRRPADLCRKESSAKGPKAGLGKVPVVVPRQIRWQVIAINGTEPRGGPRA